MLLVYGSIHTINTSVFGLTTEYPSETLMECKPINHIACCLDVWNIDQPLGLYWENPIW